MLLLTLYIILSFCLGVISFFYLNYFRSLKQAFKTEVNYEEQPFVSVVIVGRDECRNWIENIPSIINQDYANFEIVLVDDGSIDDSLKVLKDYEEQFSNVRVLPLRLNKHQYPGKKKALSEAIHFANGEWILVTDADCKPLSKNWIQSMVANIKGKDIVFGYGPFLEKKGWWQMVFQYENIYTALKYLSFALKGNPYMGVGRNMMYKKQLFLDNNGFESHMHIPSGDDDLFINEVAKADNVSICVHPDSYMFSPAPNGLKAYIRQKMRHLVVGVEYPIKMKFLLGLEAIVHFLFYIVLGLIGIFENDISIPIYILLLKWAVQYIGFWPFVIHSKQGRIKWFIPILDLFFLEIYLYISLKLFLKRQVTWR